MPRSNLTKDQRTALKELKGLKDEVILPVSKGNATVMMRRCGYDGKMEEMLGTGTYAKLRGDPTATQENRLSRKLKIHKPDVPLRPIALCIFIYIYIFFFNPNKSLLACIIVL